MKSHIINIRAETLPWQMKLLGVLLVLGAPAVIMTYWWLAIILAAAGVAILSWHSGTEIDHKNRTFREYNSCWFVRMGDREKFSGVEKIFINKAKVSQAMYTPHTANSSTMHYFIFDAYLKFDDGRKIYLASRKNKARLIKLLNPVVATLGAELSDNTVLE